MHRKSGAGRNGFGLPPNGALELITGSTGACYIAPILRLNAVDDIIYLLFNYEDQVLNIGKKETL
jgi:hypothetical protein